VAIEKQPYGRSICKLPEHKLEVARSSTTTARKQASMAAFCLVHSKNGPATFVKSFGRRQAYESPRGRNPRATGDGYGDFDLLLMSAIARPPSGSAGMNAAQRDGFRRLVVDKASGTSNHHMWTQRPHCKQYCRRAVRRKSPG
jgi:hypothetical protein